MKLTFLFSLLLLSFASFAQTETEDEPIKTIVHLRGEKTGHFLVYVNGKQETKKAWDDHELYIPVGTQEIKVVFVNKKLGSFTQKIAFDYHPESHVIKKSGSKYVIVKEKDPSDLGLGN